MAHEQNLAPKKKIAKFTLSQTFDQLACSVKQNYSLQLHRDVL